MEMPLKKSDCIHIRLTSADKKILTDLAYEQGTDVSSLFDIYIQNLKLVKPYLSRYNIKFLVESAFGGIVGSDLESIPLLHKVFESELRSKKED